MQKEASLLCEPQEVIDFWMAAGAKKWFVKDAAFDAEISARASGLHAKAARGELLDWEASETGVLGLILVLDQFSRNLYRDDVRAFAQDGLALALTRRAIFRGDDMRLQEAHRRWVYMPFMHSEDVMAQREGCTHFRERLNDADTLDYAQLHLDIIQRFGRFPHRNKVLGRESSAEEIAYLKDGGFKG